MAGAVAEARISTHWGECWRVHPDCAAALFKDLIENVRAYLKLVYPGEMTPHAKRLLEQILERHDGPGA